jgi:plastocyanin
MMKAMRKIWIAIVICLCFGLAASVDSAYSQAEKSDKIQLEKKTEGAQIIYMGAQGKINPSMATVKPGTTVIWVNQADSPVEIQFEGKQVTMACQNPVHFVVDDKGSFISNNIPMGAVASLCFIEKGDFNYVVRRALKPSQSYKTTPNEFKGKVIVE